MRKKESKGKRGLGKEKQKKRDVTAGRSWTTLLPELLVSVKIYQRHAWDIREKQKFLRRSGGHKIARGAERGELSTLICRKGYRHSPALSTGSQDQQGQTCFFTPCQNDVPKGRESELSPRFLRCYHCCVHAAPLSCTCRAYKVQTNPQLL